MRNVFGAVVPVLLLAAVTACGGTADPGASPTPSSSMSDADLQALGKQIVQCMRENGLPEMPDPYVEAGRLKLPQDGEDALKAKHNQADLDAAKSACMDLYNKVPQGAIGDGGSDKQQSTVGPENVDALRQFAKCVRENGVADWPDPNADGAFPIGGTSMDGVKPDDNPTLKGAFDACRKYWDGPMRLTKK